MTNSDDDDPDFITVPHAEVTIATAEWHNCKDLAHTISLVMSKIMSNEDQVSVLLTDDAQIQQLNNDFRGKNKATNVLSFPADEDTYLGDIAISFNTLEKETHEQDKDFNHHFIHMLIHGTLHLKGYDHETDTEAEEMEALEIKILEDMGIKNPYIDN